MATLDELNAKLDELEAKLPGIIAANRYPGDFWMHFAGEADVIEDQAGEHAAVVNQRIQAMLAQHGFYIATIEGEAP